MTTINLTLTVEYPDPYIVQTNAYIQDVLHKGIASLCEKYGLKCVIAEDKQLDLSDVAPVADCFERSNENIPAYFALDSLVSILFSVGEIRRFLALWNDVKAAA